MSGLERGAMEVSERTLREVFLPPWEAAIKDCGAMGMMATYPSVDGISAHASEKLLTHTVRGELGLDGLVLSEGGGIGTLVYEGLAPTRKEAGALALCAREITPGETIEVSIKVRSIGDRSGKEVLRLCVEDLVRSVSTPVKQLRGFAKVDLEPGERQTCVFKLTPGDLALYDQDLKRVVEPGRFRVMVGASSGDIRRMGEFRVGKW